MNAKEFQYNDVVINGFVALFVNLAILPLLIVMGFILFKRKYCFVPAVDPLSCSSYSDDSRIFFLRNRTKPGLWYSSESTRVPLPKPVSFG